MDEDTKDKVAGDVDFFDLADDFSKGLYVTTDGELYVWSADAETEKVSNDVQSVVQATDDFSTIYYRKDDSLYVKRDGADGEKIASDVYNIVASYESGELYYTKENDTEMDISEYIVDDMAEADSAMTAPDYPDFPESPEYPYRFNFDSDGEYDSAMDAYDLEYADYQEEAESIREEYDQASEAYEAKLERDYIRENLESALESRTSYALYYFDGEEETTVAENLVDGNYLKYSQDKPVVVLSTYNQSEVPTVQLSELSDSSDFVDSLDEALYSSETTQIATGATLSSLGDHTPDNLLLPKDGETLYFLSEVDEGDYYGDLYSVEINNGKLGEAELIDSDVYIYSTQIVLDNQLVYAKDMNENRTSGDLYADGSLIDYDVFLDTLNGALYYEEGILYNLDEGGDNETDALYYLSDWSSENEYGTLKQYENGEISTVSDDVSQFKLTAAGDILYLYDFSMNSYTGTLYHHNGKEATKVDDDVNTILPGYNSGLLGATYYGW